MSNLVSNVGSPIIKKLAIGMLTAYVFLFSPLNSSAQTTISGNAYYIIPDSTTQIQIEYGHYTLQFIYIDPSDQSVHIIAGDKGLIPITYFEDGTYSVEFGEAEEILDLYPLIFPNDIDEDDFYTSYHPCKLDIKDAVPFVPINSCGTEAWGAVGKEIVERPAGLWTNIHGNFTFPNLSTQGNTTPIIVSLYQENRLITSCAPKRNNYSINVYPEGVYRIFFSKAGFKTQSFTIEIKGISDLDIIQNVEFLSNFKGGKLALINPNNYDLKQNYPNPFNPSTTISFSIPKSDFVSLKIFDATGKEVANLLNRILVQGSYDVNFDGTNLTSGVYFYKLITGDFVSTKKMMLVK